MANVNITFNGKEFLLSCDDGQEEHLIELSEKLNNKDYLLSCDDGQEEHLLELAEHLNGKFDGLKSQLGNIGENKLLLITSIKVWMNILKLKKK